MLTIGQLARCYDLSTKTLRHYDSIGLFSPAVKDSGNGYRYYLPEQVKELGWVIRLRRLGVGLEDINQLRKSGVIDDGEVLRDLLRTHAARLQDEIQVRSEQISQITQLLSQTNRTTLAMQTPHLVTLPAFRVIGFSWSPQDEGSIPDMWDRFLKREHEIADAKPGSSYGLCQTLPEGQWRYLAALEVRADAPIPPGMTELLVPEQRYARFEHRGPVSGIADTHRSILSSWLPAAGLRAAEGIEFEYMDQRFIVPDHPDSVTELFVPVV